MSTSEFCYFSLPRTNMPCSLHALLQDTLDWQNFMHPSDGTQIFQLIRIRCHDLCRLLHYGSHPIKLVASHCLLEQLTRIFDQRNRTCEELRCSSAYLQSMMAITEGLVFYGDSTVAMNCGLCSSMILGWENLRLREKNMATDFKWCRLIIEELTLSLAAPGLASRSFTNQHKPATHIALALLRSDQVPEWLASVFNVRCISTIIENLSANNVSMEMVELFRELAARGYLNKEQIAGLEKVFQTCRKHMYKEHLKEQCAEEYHAKLIASPDDAGEVCNILIQLMLHSTGEFVGIQIEDGRLLNEIDLFFQESAKMQ